MLASGMYQGETSGTSSRRTFRAKNLAPSTWSTLTSHRSNVSCVRRSIAEIDASSSTCWRERTRGGLSVGDLGDVSGPAAAPEAPVPIWMASAASRASRKARAAQRGRMMNISLAAGAGGGSAPAERGGGGGGLVWMNRKRELQASGLALGGAAASKTPRPAGRVLEEPYKRAELVATRRYGYRSFGPVRWRDQVLYLPFGVVPEGMTGPPERMEEHFGSELGLSPPPVDLLALRAIEGAFLGRPHGPPHASALASWAVSPERRVALPCNLLGGGVDSRFIRQQRAEGKFAAYTCISLGGALAAVHLPGLFREGAGIERVAAAVACASTAFTFSIRRSIMYNEARTRSCWTRRARRPRRRCGRAARRDAGDSRQAAEEEASAAATARPRRGKKKKKKEHERGPRIVTGVQRARARPSRSRRPALSQISLNPQYGADTNANRRLHLLNGHLVGVLEYLFPALCAIDVKAGCDMAEIALKVLERHPYSYGTWTMHWMNPPETISKGHRDRSDAQEAYAALVYFHPEGKRDRPLHRLRFPALGISLDLRHGDVVFIRGHMLEHEVVASEGTDARYCIVFTLGKNLKVDADSGSSSDSSTSSDSDSSSSED
eukprot:tig00000104_g4813.t1